MNREKRLLVETALFPCSVTLGVVAAVALALAAVGCGVGAWRLGQASPLSVILIMGGCLLLITAAGFLVFPVLQREKAARREEEIEHLDALRAMLKESEKSVKEYRRARVAVEALRESVAGERAPIEEMARQLQDGLFRFRALEDDLQQTRQQNDNLTRQLHGWTESAIAFFDFLQRVLTLFSPDDNDYRLIDQVAATFARYCEARGLDRIAPVPGDPLLPGLHRVVGEAPTEDVPAGTIFSCEAWGYRMGNTTLKPAYVVLARQPATEDVSAETF